MNISLSSSELLHFSSSIPDLLISSIIGTAVVSISSSGTQFYSSQIYIDSQFTLHMRPIIALHLQLHRLPCAVYSITVTPADTTVTPKQTSLTVIFSRGSTNTPALLYSRQRFLTLYDTKILPSQAAFDTVSLYMPDAQDQDAALLTLKYRISGSSLIRTVLKGQQLVQGYNRIDLNFQQYLDEVRDSLSGSSPVVIPVSATLTAGDRLLTYHFTHLHPSSAISYINQFNAPEHIWLFGSWKRSGKISQKTATVQAHGTPHSLEIQPEFEITTHPLDFRSAYIFPEVAMSPLIWAYVFAEGSPLATSAFEAIPTEPGRSSLASLSFKAVPTEGSLDASPQDTEPATHTVRFKAVDDSAALGFQFDIHRIFTDQFRDPFI